MPTEWDDEFFVVLNEAGHALGYLGFGDTPPLVFGASVLGRSAQGAGLRCVPVKIVAKEQSK